MLLREITHFRDQLLPWRGSAPRDTHRHEVAYCSTKQNLFLGDVPCLQLSLEHNMARGINLTHGIRTLRI